MFSNKVALLRVLGVGVDISLGSREQRVNDVRLSSVSDSSSPRSKRGRSYGSCQRVPVRGDVELTVGISRAYAALGIERISDRSATRLAVCLRVSTQT